MHYGFYFLIDTFFSMVGLPKNLGRKDPAEMSHSLNIVLKSQNMVSAILYIH